jgi:phosphoglycerate dehydrogenase-like enzyme
MWNLCDISRERQRQDNMANRILVTTAVGPIRDGFFPKDVIDRLESLGDVQWNERNEVMTADELRQRIVDIDVCMTGWGTVRYDRNIIDAARRLRVIAHTGGTVAGLVSDTLYDRDIHVISGNQLYAESVAEGVIAYMQSALRKIPFFHQELQQGRWYGPGQYFNEGLLGQRIGLVGFGAVARYLVKMLVPFHTSIMACDPFVADDTFREYGVTRASMDEIFTQSKIISLHAAKTPSTDHLVGASLLAKIQDDALLINTARASIIDTDALVAELRKNRFKAVLDVYDVEPLPADSPLIGLPNVMLLPHMGGPTIDRWKIVTHALIDDIQTILEGGSPRLGINRAYAMAMTR